MIQMKQLHMACITVYFLALACSASHQGSFAGQHGVPPPTPTISVNRNIERDREIIKSGHGAGALQLGDTREQVLKVLGEKREEYAHDYPCKYTEIHWYDAERDSNGIFVYLKDDLVF